jgi:hypothetical protein
MFILINIQNSVKPTILKLPVTKTNQAKQKN